MTKVSINPGVCGMDCRVVVSKIDRMNLKIEVESKCPMVIKMSEQITEVNLRDALKKYGQSIVTERAAEHLAHAACPVPTAIIKAIEAESGMALPRNATITFETE